MLIAPKIKYRDTVKLESAFTLVELLLVIAIIGILSSLALTAFQIYKSDAAYSIISSTLHAAQTAFEAGINDIDNPPASVGLTNQLAAGPIQDLSAQALLPGMMLPISINFEVQYDSTCMTAACQSASIQIKHCNGNEYIRWVRFGDGLSLIVDHIAGPGCS